MIRLKGQVCNISTCLYIYIYIYIYIYRYIIHVPTIPFIFKQKENTQSTQAAKPHLFPNLWLVSKTVSVRPSFSSLLCFLTILIYGVIALPNGNHCPRPGVRATSALSVAHWFCAAALYVRRGRVITFLGGVWARVRSHCRFRNRGPKYFSESGMKWMSGSAKRQCDRALCPTRADLVGSNAAARSSRAAEGQPVPGEVELSGPARSV